MKTILNANEVQVLFRQINGQGGFQGFLTSLQNKTDKETGELNLSDDDIKRIGRYVSGSGGYQSRLVEIFKRHLNII